MTQFFCKEGWPMLFKRSKKLIADTSKIISCLSKEKLNTYQRFIKDNNDISLIEIYVRVQMASSFLFLALQFIEITLRNRMYDAVCDCFSQKISSVPQGETADRWFYWLPQKNSKTHLTILDADKRAHREITTRGVVVGDIIARLPFGTWVNLLSEQPDNKSPLHFWQYASRDIFPNAPRRKQSLITHRFREINDIRNRLFHFEPVWNTQTCQGIKQVTSDIEKKHALVMESIQWMSDDIPILFDTMGHKKFIDDMFNRMGEEFPQTYN
jgi:hypothetical protein